MEKKLCKEDVPMNVSAHRAFSLLKELAFERVSCSAAEELAASRLLE